MIHYNDINRYVGRPYQLFQLKHIYRRIEFRGATVQVGVQEVSKSKQGRQQGAVQQRS